jgi:hypothetical protein
MKLFKLLLVYLGPNQKLEGNTLEQSRNDIFIKPPFTTTTNHPPQTFLPVPAYIYQVESQYIILEYAYKSIPMKKKNLPKQSKSLIPGFKVKVSN